MTASKGGMVELAGLDYITFNYAIPEPWADRLRALGIKHPADWYVWVYPDEGPVNLAEETVRYLTSATVDLGQVSERLARPAGYLRVQGKPVGPARMDQGQRPDHRACKACKGG